MDATNHGRRGGQTLRRQPAHLGDAHQLRESGSSFTEIAQALAIGTFTVRRALISTSVPDPDPDNQAAAASPLRPDRSK